MFGYVTQLRSHSQGRATSSMTPSHYAPVSAAAMKAMGGEIQAQLAPQSDAEHDAMTNAGYDLEQVLTQDELIRSDNCFFAATGLTDGALLRGVRFDSQGARTQSLVMRSRSGTVRMIDATHRVSKLREFAAIDY